SLSAAKRHDGTISIARAVETLTNDRLVFMDSHWKMEHNDCQDCSGLQHYRLGQLHTKSHCGSISTDGLFTAPKSVPDPSSREVREGSMTGLAAVVSTSNVRWN